MKTKQMIFQAMAAMLFVFPLHAKSQIIYPRDSSYTLSPDTVNPGAPFVLHAYNKSFTCNTRFFNQNIQVNGDSVFFSFMDTTALTGIACINASFGPSVKFRPPHGMSKSCRFPGGRCKVFRLNHKQELS